MQSEPLSRQPFLVRDLIGAILARSWRDRQRSGSPQHHTVLCKIKNTTTVPSTEALCTMATTAESLKSLIYEPGEKPSLKVLDQLKIPAEKVFIPVSDIVVAWSVIHEMKIRGTSVSACLS